MRIEKKSQIKSNLKNMLNTNFLYGVTGNLIEILPPNRAIIHFELQGVMETAFLESHRFYKDGKCLGRNQNLNKFIRLGQKVKFSCHINDHPNPGQCKWFVTNCWRHIEDDMNTVVMSTGVMNAAGSVTNLKQRQGILTMTDLLGNEYKVHFLASKFYLYGKRLAASKPLASQLQIDDKLYFDAIPCFPEENIHKCNWFATCVHKGKKPENVLYKDQSKTEITEFGQEKIFNQYVGSERSARSETELSNELQNIYGESSPSHFLRQETFATESESVVTALEPASRVSHTFIDDKHSCDLSSTGEVELAKTDSFLKLEYGSKLSAKMLHDIKLLTTNPKTVFAKSTGIIMGIINEEYGVILGEFQRNNFQSILFHRSNAFLFKMNLAHSKLTEIFVEGDRVRFIAVGAPQQFVCEWIATQVSVYYETEEKEEEGGKLPQEQNAINDLCES